MKKLFGLLTVAVLVSGFSKSVYAYDNNKLWDQWTAADKAEYLQDEFAKNLLSVTYFIASLDTSDYSYIGIGVRLEEHKFSETEGLVVISGMLKDSPAEKAGVQRDDLVLSVNGKPIHFSKDFVAAVQEADSEVELEIEKLQDSSPVVRDVCVVCKKALVGQELKAALDAKKESWTKQATDLEKEIAICQLKVTQAGKSNDNKALDALLFARVELTMRFMDLRLERLSVISHYYQ